MSMDKPRERKGSASVPEFGAWDEWRSTENLDYSLLFAQARANKKQYKQYEQEIPGKHKQKNNSPNFGAWDKKTEGNPKHFKVSPRARSNKKPHKHDLTRRSLGNEEELHKHQEVPPMKHCPMSVPSFGDWNEKYGDTPDNLEVSPKAFADKKQHNHDLACRCLGNEQQLGKHQDVSPTKNSPTAVSQNGTWNQEAGDNPNSSKVTSQARAKKKQHRHDVTSYSLGNEQELGKHEAISPMKTGWLSVPQFGEWDQKSGSETNYSVVFSQARANRKHHKSDLTHRSFDFEQELLYRQRDQPPKRKKKKFLTYFTRCLPV